MEMGFLHISWPGLAWNHILIGISFPRNGFLFGRRVPTWKPGFCCVETDFLQIYDGQAWFEENLIGILLPRNGFLFGHRVSTWFLLRRNRFPAYL